MAMNVLTMFADVLSTSWEKWDSIIMDQLGPVGDAIIERIDDGSVLFRHQVLGNLADHLAALVAQHHVRGAVRLEHVRHIDDVRMLAVGERAPLGDAARATGHNLAFLDGIAIVIERFSAAGCVAGDFNK